jgi:hypothetical protein
MAGGEASLHFLFFFFCSAAFTTEIAVATTEANFFATVDLVLHRDFAAPMTGSAPASASATSPTHNSPVDDLLEAYICPTSASGAVSPPPGEALGATSGARTPAK